jgi:carbohydrate kinase (thermoresistant glucokinase family)
MIILLMGPMGSGKTTIGKLLAERLQIPFLDADDLHPAHNRAKMAQGLSLNDEDREPWLRAVHEKIFTYQGHGPKAVLACSALKQKYRDLLSNGSDIRWVYLKGERELLEARVKSREGHFASSQILSTQLVDLEEPKDALWIDIRSEPIMIVDRILKGIEGLNDLNAG